MSAQATEFRDEAAAMVAKGATWLDNRVYAWFQQVDPARLDLTSCEDCVAGQLFGDYNRLPRYGLSYEQRCELGFFLASHYMPEDRLLAWEILTDAWVDEILKRRKAKETCRGRHLHLRPAQW